MIRFFPIFALTATLLLASGVMVSCTKEAGLGGFATVEGRVYVNDYFDGTNTFKANYYGADERVHIMYGDDRVPSNDMRTGPDGNYRFVKLVEGKYTVYCYSECAPNDTACKSGVKAIEYAFEITDRKQAVVLPDITVRR